VRKDTDFTEYTYHPKKRPINMADAIIPE